MHDMETFTYYQAISNARYGTVPCAAAAYVVLKKGAHVGSWLGLQAACSYRN